MAVLHCLKLFQFPRGNHSLKYKNDEPGSTLRYPQGGALAAC